MRLRLALLAAAAALAVAGCGSTESSSAGDFQGQEAEVAQVVEDLQRAGQAGDPDRICGDILTAKLAEEIGKGGTSCADEVDKAIGDSEDFELRVTDVTVTGSSATAKVQQGGDGKATATFELARERGRWRIASFAPAGG
jgi:outer membrane lipoprotein SlyB